MDARDPGAEKLRRDLIALVRDLVRELHPQRAGLSSRPSSRIERDLGIDSLPAPN